MEDKKLFTIFQHILILSLFQYLFFKISNSKVSPSFYLTYILLLSLDGNFEIALFLSFLTGILTDIMTKTILGSTGIKFLIIVYLSSFFVVKSIIGKSILTFIFSFFYFILLSLKGIEIQGFWYGMTLIKYGFIFSFYNVLSGIIIQLIFLKKIWREKIF